MAKTNKKDTNALTDKEIAKVLADREAEGGAFEDNEVKEAVNIMEKCGALEECHKQANGYLDGARKTLSKYPKSEARELFEELLEYDIFFRLPYDFVIFFCAINDSRRVYTSIASINDYFNSFFEIFMY